MDSFLLYFLDEPSNDIYSILLIILIAQLINLMTGPINNFLIHTRFDKIILILIAKFSFFYFLICPILTFNFGLYGVSYSYLTFILISNIYSAYLFLRIYKSLPNH